MERLSIYTLKGFALVLLVMLSACSTAPSVTVPEPSFSFQNEQLFGEQQKVLSDSQIHLLSPQQEQAFLAYFNHPSRLSIPAHQRVSHYLQLKSEYFTYSNATLTAEQALRFGRGNCLSLAILTTAFAELAGIEARYELVDSAPIFQLQNSVVIKALHVRAILLPEPVDAGKTEGSSIITDFTFGGRATSSQSVTDIYIDFFSSYFTNNTERNTEIYIDSFSGYFPNQTQGGVEDVPYQSYLAMYYLNVAAEAIIRQDYVNAYWLTLEAMSHDPTSSVAFNNMAVIHRRVGDEAKAELFYQYGIEHLDDKLSLLKNYQALLNGQNRLEEAERIGQQITALDDPSPIDWYFAGKDSQNNGEFRQAIGFYAKAIAIAPYLHEAYLGLAQSHYQLGQLKEAEAQLKMAIENSKNSDSTSLYQAKLMALNREL